MRAASGAVACLFIVAVAAFAQVPPDAATILLAREREAHERAVAARIEYQIAKQPKPVAAPEPAPRKLSAAEVQQLRDALDRYFRENGGRVPIFWRCP
jgi:hypothetical protein